MDYNKVESLKQKRILLQKEIRLKKVRDRINSELNYLQKHNFQFNVFYDYKYINWIHENIQVRNKDGYHGSHGDFQIDVNDIEAICTEKGKKDDFLKITSIKEFFDNISDDKMLIVCSLTGNPEYEISKNTFLSKPSIFLSSPENWVLTADKKYIIESIWDQDTIRFINITQATPVLQIKLVISPL